MVIANMELRNGRKNEKKMQETGETGKLLILYIKSLDPVLILNYFFNSSFTVLCFNRVET